MSLQQLFANLDDIIRTPEDVAQLATAIVDLAISGKLVPQDETEESAAGLLQKLRTAKGRLGMLFDSGEGVEGPYIVPSKWQWCKWIDVSLIITDVDHKMPAEQLVGIPYISPKDFTADGRIDFVNAKKISQEDYRALAEKVKPESGDLIFPRYGTIGVTRLVDVEFDFLVSYSCAIVKHMKGFIEPRYVYYYSQTSLVKDEIRRYINRTTQPNVGIRSIQQFLFPLPPLAEQHRIVAKVDELLAQTRALEANLRRAQEEIVVVNQAALHRLETAEDPASLHAAWHTISDAFDLLYDDPRPLAALRQTILQLAVSGKLVRQDVDDETVESLLQWTSREKNRQANDGKDTNRSMSSISSGERPFLVPTCWRWVKLGDLVESMTNGLYKPASFYSDRGVISIRMYNIQGGKINFAGAKRVEVTTEERANYALRCGDLLVNRVNSKELVGKAALVDSIHEDIVYESMNVRVRFVETTTVPQYINVLFRTPYIQTLFRKLAKKAIGQASINQSQIAKLAIPLPPLAEQRRIVAKVDELLDMCDALERQLDRSAAAQKAAVASVLAHLSQEG